ncbi:MAG: hypothetical protein ACI8W7_003996, partial [Gammaproteobacteria bacterium]
MATRLRPPGPAELIHIRELLSADEQVRGAFSVPELRERDRAFGRETTELVRDPLAQVMAWHHQHEGLHAQRNTAARGLALACVLVGVVAGAITAFGSFFYDGGQRVNVLLVLALFGLFPLLSIIAFVIASFSRDGLAAISGGHFGTIIARVMPCAQLSKVAGLASGTAGPEVAKWLLLGWSQCLGLGFGAGALGVAIALILFTDLAFGWSTTIEVSSDTFLSAVRAAALPWQLWLPQAVPDESLINASRYFRISTNTARDVDPIVLARWWPFVVMAMLCYGVLPRLVTLAVARWRLRVACAQALLNDSRVIRLLQRMNTPLVRTQSPQSEQRTGSPAGSPAPMQVFVDLPTAEQWQVVNWAAVPVHQGAIDQLLRGAQRGSAVRARHAAGGARSSTQDSELIAQLAEQSPDLADAVLVIAKSWEPPTLDLMDFISALRSALADHTVLAIMPLAVQHGAPAAPSAAHHVAWQHALGRAQLGNVHAVIVREE